MPSFNPKNCGIPHQIGIKKSQEKEFEFQGGSKPTRRLTETRSRAKLFDATIMSKQFKIVGDSLS